LGRVGWCSVGNMLSWQNCSNTLVPVILSSLWQELDEQKAKQELDKLEQELAVNISDKREQLGQWAWL
jgi:hypothetical protein